MKAQMFLLGHAAVNVFWQSPSFVTWFSQELFFSTTWPSPSDDS